MPTNLQYLGTEKQMTNKLLTMLPPTFTVTAKDFHPWWKTTSPLLNWLPHFFFLLFCLQAMKHPPTRTHIVEPSAKPPIPNIIFFCKIVAIFPPWQQTFQNTELIYFVCVISKLPFYPWLTFLFTNKKSVNCTVPEATTVDFEDGFMKVVYWLVCND